MRRVFAIILLLTQLSAFVNNPAHAVPAKPGLITMQNDGTPINIYIQGDENFHYYLSEDGYILTENNGIFTYATVDSHGNLNSTGVKATPLSARDAETSVMLGSINREHELKKLYDSRQQKARKVIGRATSSPSKGLFPGTHFPAYGEQKALVILVEYADIRFTLGNPHDYFSRLLNEPGFSDYGGTGSAKDYFMENSKGQFQPHFDVFGPVTLSKKRSYYGSNDYAGNDNNPHEMVIEACLQLDETVDFSQYDRDGDGFIDNVFVFYAGRGENSGGGSQSVWPHSWNITSATNTPYVLDGVQLDYYACTNEWIDNHPDGIGTFVHEFSHLMGLPDLYATSYTSKAFTPGEWSVMDYGSYNNGSCTPPMYSAFERYALGWGQPVTLDKAQNATLPPISSNTFAVIPTDNENEYFMLENRQQTSWDEYLPGHGMLIWHIDYNPNIWTTNRVNNNASHQYVDIEEADGTQTPYSRESDAFPGKAGATSFTDDTNPSMRTWSNTPLNTPITEISEDNEGTIRFKVKGGRTPISSVNAMNATDIGTTTFTACWQPAAEAPASYLLNVYRKNDGAIADLRSYRVEDATAKPVDGLRPDTYYYYTVSVTDALEVSEPSNEIEVLTKSTTGLESIADNPAEPVWHLIGHDLLISVAHGVPCSVCDIAGKIIARLNGPGTITLPANGFYILSIGESKPVIIRR